MGENKSRVGRVAGVSPAPGANAGGTPATQFAIVDATINPAKICGVADRLGSIEKGKDADLVLWESDPFDARTRPAAVWITGRPVDLTIKSIKPF
jgi:imidazolonepropionase-like amidohydrolase